MAEDLMANLLPICLRNNLKAISIKRRFENENRF